MEKTGVNQPNCIARILAELLYITWCNEWWDEYNLF